MSLRLHSVMLGVTNLDASVAFYTERLGFTLCGRFEQFAFIEPSSGPEGTAGGPMLTLSVPLAQARPPVPAPVELVIAVDGVREAYERLRERGVTFAGEPRSIDGTNDVANFTDPDGHVLSLYGPP
ncbi:MAG TPA: VOC family protein [Candidatus Elarobacter sp.]|jgi:catechol 2,3-dioxygenase-like lactoylglutathione lyase family enzyme|nr:VOC family protein [Candidatus Elarobacter sp.]